MKIIICGIDKTGKDTLIKNLQNKLGYYPVIHHNKPQQLTCYSGDRTLELYQLTCFSNMFRILKSPNINIMMNRAHLGEFVYAQRYRNYSGDYVFELEKKHEINNYGDVFLILLTCSDTSIMVDDGESHDFSKKDEEQLDFIAAYDKSIIMHKLMLNVYDQKTQTYKSQEQIMDHVLSFLKITLAKTDFRVL